MNVAAVTPMGQLGRVALLTSRNQFRHSKVDGRPIVTVLFSSAKGHASFSTSATLHESARSAISQRIAQDDVTESSRLDGKILAVDNNSPVSRFALYIRAGSRYEPDDVPGITHYVRASAGLTTKNSSVFGITRSLERAGALFRATSEREYIIYRVQCLRDKLDQILGFIDDTVHHPEFRPWELNDYVWPRLREELGRYKKNQKLVTDEAMHKAAFRGGLAHSLFLPEHQVEAIKKDHLFEYLNNNYVIDRMSFVGLGVSEDALRSTIEGRFRFNEGFKGVSGDTRYVGGEARIQAGFGQTMVNFVVQGSPITDVKRLATLEVIGSMIGSSNQAPIKYGQGPVYTLANLMKSLSPSLKTSVVNINYSDTGLFGFSLIGPNETLKQAVKQAVQHLRSLNNINENDFKSAKVAAKTRALLRSENQDAVFEAMGRRLAAGVPTQTPVDLIDKVTLKDVRSLAETMLKGKPTLVSVGNPRYVPYVDELDK